MKKIIIGTLVVLVLVTGCGKVPKLKNGEEAIVTMKGESISVDSFYEELKEDYGLNVLVNKIDKQILTKLFPSDEDETKYINNQLETIKYYYENYYKSQYSSFEEYLTQNGVENEDELKDNLSLSYKREQAVKRYAKTLVTDKEIEKYYDEKIFGDITASHILIKPNVSDSATDDEKAKAEEEALKKAKEIITKLKNGAKFEDLAKEYSDDTSNSASGGKLPAFNHGQMVEEFEEAAKKLKNGEYSQTPVKTEYGYHIIYKESQKEKPALKDVKDDIIDSLVEEKISADENMSTTALIELRKEYKVEIVDKDLKKKYEAYVTKNS